MLGVLITLLFSAGAACFGHLLIRRVTRSLDPALRLGLVGLIGLGALGTLSLFIGLAPGGLRTGGTLIVVLIATASAALAVRSKSYRVPMALPKGPQLLLLLPIALACLMALIGVLAPADTVEWDSLAYHLAVPKLWLKAGQIYPISFIHHSNFPFAVDNLYIWGLSWGGESGAKAFTLAFHLFGICAVFGLARQVYGQLAAWWSSLAWTTIPVVLWLSGTAYIDVQNGLYAGLGIALAALWIRERSPNLPWLAGILLGLAAGSKYTGLQTIFAVGAVAVVAMVLSRKQDSGLPVKGLAIAAGLALVISAPWYIKNTIWAGNPVYPFFYGKLGGKNWSEWQASIYQVEQQSFGVGREGSDGHLKPQEIAHAILGLGYQPGRYVNPGQTIGGGFPIGAVGFVVVGTLIVWLISGRTTAFESAVLGTILLSLAMWFVLSQQSRYIIALGVPLSVLAGGGVLRLRAGPILAGAIVLQALVSFYVQKTLRLDTQLPVAFGRVSKEEYRQTTTAFSQPAAYLNETVKDGKVALYDEVFGFLLEVDYFWANPGHTSELGYESMENGGDLVSMLNQHRFTHVYINLLPPGTDKQNPDIQAWLNSTGLFGPATPMPAGRRGELMKDLNWRYKILLAEAMAQGRLIPIQSFGPRVILQVR